MGEREGGHARPSRQVMENIHETGTASTGTEQRAVTATKNLVFVIKTRPLLGPSIRYDRSREVIEA